MMTTEEWLLARSWLDGELSRLSYVSDAWHFEMSDNPADGLAVVVRWTFTSRHDDEKVITFTRREGVNVIAKHQDLAGLHRTVHGMISTIEAHERLEWFHRDGRPVYDPHPDGPNIPQTRPVERKY